MPDQDIFAVNEKDQTPVTPVKEGEEGKPTQPQVSNYDQMLQMIVNPDGQPKYKSVEDALRGASHAQAHIATLEQELAQLRANGESTKKVEDILEALKSQEKQDQVEPVNQGEKALTPDEIQKLVQNTVTDMEKRSTQAENIKKVASKFKELYGEKASETLYGKAEDLGFSKEDINGLIAKSPKAAFKLLGVEETRSSNSDTVTPGVNTEGFQHKSDKPAPSSMGYVSSKQLTTNWMESKKKTLKRLGLDEN